MSVKTFFIYIFLGSAFAAILFTGGRYYLQPDRTESAASPSVAPKQLAPIPDFTITALQTSPDDRRVINCQNNRCLPLPAVSASITGAVTDGQTWYHYQETKKDKTSQTVLQLKRTWINQNKSDLIIEQTKLVKPRGLYISPDTKKVAFWLDNTSEPSKKLTELWLYDADSMSTKLLAENINANSIIIEPRWNRASTHLWFLGETLSADKKPSTGLHVISLQPPSFGIQFGNINWSDLTKIVQSEPMDLDATGQALAYTEPKENKTILHIQRDENTAEVTTISGAVPYIQWLPDESLLYVVQSRFSFTFWQVKGSVHKHIAKYQGVFQSARADSAGAFLLFNTQPISYVSHAYALEVSSGRIAHQTLFPRYGDQTFLIHFELDSPSQNPDSNITAPIDDEQIAAFLDKNIKSIAEPKAVPQRFITTDQINTVWFDYSVESGAKKRVLLTIKDATHTEWSISARYRESAGEWLQEQGNVPKPPQPVRVYEWEDAPQQWILKETIDNKSL
jgi:hypothetical protein